MGLFSRVPLFKEPLLSVCVWMEPWFCCLPLGGCLSVNMEKAQCATYGLVHADVSSFDLVLISCGFRPPVPCSLFIWESSPPPAHSSAHSDGGVKLSLSAQVLLVSEHCVVCVYVCVHKSISKVGNCRCMAMCTVHILVSVIYVNYMCYSIHSRVSLIFLPHTQTYT